MAVPVSLAIKTAVYTKKYWKEIIIGVIGILLFILSVPAMIVGIILPSDKNSGAIDIYKQVAQDAGISWVELVAIDTVRKENDLRNSSYNSVRDVALDFYNLEVTRYQEDSHGNWTLVGTDWYSGNAIKSFISSQGYSSEGKFQNIKNAISSINEKVEYDAILHYKTFEEVITLLPQDKKEWAVGLLASGGIQQVYGVTGFEEIVLSEISYPSGGIKIPLFLQSNWSNVPYGSFGTIASSGCGPTALAMVVVGLTGRTDISPATVGNWSVENGYRAVEGSSWDLMTEGGEYFGLNVEVLSRKNPSRIVKELSEGHPIIASMQRGHFTQGGHFIVLRGVTNSGKILVNDSNSTENTNIEWDLAVIMNESSTLGGVDGCPFWVYIK